VLPSAQHTRCAGEDPSSPRPLAFQAARSLPTARKSTKAPTSLGYFKIIIGTVLGRHLKVTGKRREVEGPSNNRYSGSTNNFKRKPSRQANPFTSCLLSVGYVPKRRNAVPEHPSLVRSTSLILHDKT